MQRISVLAHYLWLRAMDLVCVLRGHKLTNFPRGRFCLRCYRVEGVDFASGRREPTGSRAESGSTSGPLEDGRRRTRVEADGPTTKSDAISLTR